MCSRLMFSESILIPGKNVISISGAWWPLKRGNNNTRTLVECLLKSLI